MRVIKSKPNSKILITVQTPTKRKKICRFFFTKTDTSLYICFYFKGKEYYYGCKNFQEGIEKLTFNFKEGRHGKICPKLSYHQSGEIHFKIKDQKESVEKVIATPLKKLCGEHIITIIIEGLDDFEDFKNSDYGLAIKFPIDVEGLKLTIWGIAGELELAQLRKKYNFGFMLRRINPTQLIHFGVKINTQKSISEDKSSGLTVITGWDKSAADVNNTATLLYLQGKI